MEGCPLFMDALPSDFVTNSALAALASMMPGVANDSEPVHEEVLCKCERQQLRQRRRYAPYSRTKKPKACQCNCKRQAAPQQPSQEVPTDQRSSIEVGEASLFLQLWRL
eukprot:c9635_g1_i3.p2 GENE.c9635_g1_i3~~c9635_g1_i3.p2  ORF type:complete len:109 (+),score=16.49 c9635_g1_i3:35-361(+)